MEECEICGAKSNDVYIVDVEEVELRVCTKCAKGRKIISKPVESRGRRAAAQVQAKKDEPQLVEDYGMKIHDARELMHLPLKVLAEMINEKETLLLRVEQQKTMPSVALAKKLERALKIKLAEPEQQSDETFTGGGGGRAVLGDFMGRK
ncbi:MAG: helix-turn-helix domain-containing protein [Candidatus Micrarchaeaceae archaeon]